MNIIRISIYLFSFTIIMGCNDPIHPQLKVFRYNESSGISTLDPAFAKSQAIIWPVHQLYNTLVEVNDQMQIKPSIAKSWEFSNDKCTITFHLRTDAYFHNDPVFKNGVGRKLVSNDVVFSLNRIIDKNTASPGSWIFNDKITSINPFSAINDSTFELHLIQPFHPILGVLSMQYCSIVPKEAVDFYGSSFRSHPVGTGPFRFIAWEEGQGLLLAKNERYFEKDQNGIQLPYLDRIKISFYDSKATEFLAFQQHHLDFINDLDVSFKDEVLTKTGNLKNKWKDKIILDKHAYLNTEYIGILADTNNVLLKNSPLRLKKIRAAINYGIDRKKMLLYLRNSIGTAANSGFIPVGLPSFDSSLVKGFQYDPTKAKQLLADAGFDNTHPMPFVKLLTVPNYASLGIYIVNELKQLGINVIVETVQKSLLLEQTSKSQALLFRGSWIADYPDAENYLSVFYSKNPAPPNYTRYSNPAYDLMYEQSLKETNDSIRYALYRKMDNIILADVPIIPLWYDMVIHLVHPNIKNFHSNSLNLLELKRVDKEN